MGKNGNLWDFWKTHICKSPIPILLMLATLRPVVRKRRMKNHALKPTVLIKLSYYILKSLPGKQIYKEISKSYNHGAHQIYWKINGFLQKMLCQPKVSK